MELIILLFAPAIMVVLFIQVLNGVSNARHDVKKRFRDSTPKVSKEDIETHKNWPKWAIEADKRMKMGENPKYDWRK